MKVPTRVTPRTSAPNLTQQAYQSDAGAGRFASAAGGIGTALAGLGAAYTALEQRTERFDAMRAYNDFETQSQEQFQADARGAPANGAGFAAGQEAALKKREQDFVSNLPPSMREEYSIRAQDFTGKLHNRAVAFQYQLGDQYFRNGISEVYSGAQTALDPRTGGDPNNLGAQVAKVNSAIDSSDLPQVEKDALKRKMLPGLAAVTYRADSYANSMQYGSNVDTANLIKGFEGYRPEAYYDVNAFRTGYGSDTTTRADGRVERVTKDTKISREDAERDLARRIPIFQARVVEQIGGEAWGALSPNAKAGLTSVTYNYGSLPSSVVDAVRTGDAFKIAGAVESLSANPDRRKKEAAIIRGEASVPSPIDSDPRYANVPYEDRLAMQADAAREATADLTAQQKAKNLQYESQLNNILSSIHDGKAGQTDIDAFRQSHPGMDFSDVEKLDATLKKATESTLGAAQVQARMDAGLPVDPTDPDVKKGLNALVGQSGLDAISAGNQDYVTNGLMPIVTKSNAVPSDVVGLLTGMVRSNNQAQAQFALNALAQIQDGDRRAFDQSVSSSVAKDVDFWNARKNLMPADELFKLMSPAKDAATRNMQDALRKEAETYLATKENKIATLDTLVSKFRSGQNGWFSGGPLVLQPGQAQALSADYQTMFTDAYVKYGNADEAKAAAEKELGKIWAVTSAGDGRLMKYPPEVVGYRPYNGSYDWLNKEAKREWGLQSNSRFELVSDEQTAREFSQWQSGQLDRLPSYGGVEIKDGVVRALPGRKWFAVPAATRAADEAELIRANEVKRVQSRMNELNAVSARGASLGQVLSEDEQTEYNDLAARVNELNAAAPKKPGVTPGVPTDTPLF